MNGSKGVDISVTRSRKTLGLLRREYVGNHGVGMTVTYSVLLFEHVYQLHVLGRQGLANKVLPFGNGTSVRLLN